MEKPDIVVPCKDCITLPICKQLFINKDTPFQFMTNLHDKCSLCKKYSIANTHINDNCWWTSGEEMIFNFFKEECKE